MHFVHDRLHPLGEQSPMGGQDCKSLIESKCHRSQDGQPAETFWDRESEVLFRSGVS
jgi:hypothetical protein